MKISFTSIFISLQLLFSSITCSKNKHGNLNEILNIYQLPNNYALFDFQFNSIVPFPEPEKQDYQILPRALGQLFFQLDLKELHLTFTRGRWNYQLWNLPKNTTSISSSGLQIYSYFNPVNNASLNNIETQENWKRLCHTLSGIFCSGLSQVDTTNSIIPNLSYSAQYLTQQLSPILGSLPLESTCTENLTPWLKLLPCRNQYGIGTLLHSYDIYESNYLSVGLTLRQLCGDLECSMKNSRLMLTQKLSLVFDKSIANNQNWNFETFFKRSIDQSCSVCKISQVIFHQAKELGLSQPPSYYLTNNRALYDLKSIKKLDLSVTPPKSNDINSNPFQSVRIDRYLTKRKGLNTGMLIEFDNSGNPNPVRAVYLETLPWYLKVYLHTLKISTNGDEDPKVVEKQFYQPGQNRIRPNVMEWQLLIPAKSKVTIRYKMDMVLLRYTEYPPDPNKGMSIPGASVTLFDLDSTTLHSQDSIKIYTNTISLPLRTPDFSMPYNVIMLTCTLLAMFFGSIFNSLQRDFSPIQSEENDGNKKNNATIEKSGANDNIEKND